MPIRPAAAADLECLLALQATYYREDGYTHHHSAARRAWAGLLADDRQGRAWVVEADAGAVGYVVVTFGYSLEYLGRDAFVDEIYIAREYRGQGLGRAALTEAEEACRVAGVGALHVEVESDKQLAIDLYRRRGFADHRRVLMTKHLDGAGGVSGARDA